MHCRPLLALMKFRSIFERDSYRLGRGSVFGWHAYQATFDKAAIELLSADGYSSDSF